MKKLFTKKSVIRLSLFALALFPTPALAQDAFYIYRNDGDFNGFFFDEVIRMSFSKVDPQGVEHEEYVVQEIETADSLYCIPLCAIDSIGFQQPEIILNPKVKHIDQLGMKQYMKDFYAYQDKDVFFKLNADTPKELVPQVGDILVNFGDPSLRYSLVSEDDFTGLACKVDQIKRYDERSQWYVYCVPLDDISDLFVQLISTEEISVDADGNVRRRMAGYDPERGPRKAAGSARASLIDYSGTLHRDFSPKEGLSIGLEAGLGLKTGLRMAYNISSKRILVKTAVDTKVSVKPALSVKGSGSFTIPVAGMPKFINSIKFPAIAPLFQTRPFPDIFVRGGGDLTLKATLPAMNLDWRQVFTFDTDNPFMASYFMALNGPDDISMTDLFDLSSADLSMSLNGFLQTGISLSANIETNDWWEKIFSSSISLDFYCGPKVEGSLNLSLAGLQQAGAYGMLKDSYVKAHACSADLEAKAKLSCLWKDPQETTFFDASKQWGTATLYLFPGFAPTEAEYDAKTGDIVATVHPSRMTLLPCKVGISVLDYKGDEVDRAVNPKTHYLAGFGYDFTNHFSGLPCGRYIVRPFIEMAGVEIPVTEYGREVIITPMLDLREDSIDVSQDGGTMEFAFVTNVPQVEQGSAYSFIHVTIEETDLKERLSGMTVKVDPNYTLFPRTGRVILIAKAGTYVTRDTLVIHQESSRTFTYASASVTYAKTTKSGHAWGVSNGERYDRTATTEESGSMACAIVPLSCTRSGNIITCTGRYTYDMGYPLDRDDYYEKVQGAQTGYKEWTCHLEIDVTDPTAPRVTGGSCKYVMTIKSNSVAAHYGGLGEAYQLWYTKTNNSSLDTEESFSWSHDIPYVDAPNKEWQDYTGNKLETHGTMRFYLGGKQNVSFSRYDKSYTYYDQFYNNNGDQGDNKTENGTASYSGFVMDDDSYIQIYLAY